MPWKNVKVRLDLHGIIAQRAASESRSVAQMADLLLMRALEQETNTSASSGGGGSYGAFPGESERGANVGHGETREGDASSVDRVEVASSPVRASNERADGETGAGTVSHRPSPSSAIAGQTTVDEMQASCPQCAGEMHVVDISRGGQVIAQNAMGCLDCGFVREPEGT